MGKSWGRKNWEERGDFATPCTSTSCPLANITLKSLGLSDYSSHFQRGLVLERAYALPQQRKLLQAALRLEQGLELPPCTEGT